ncbi:hypothetical protein ID866_625 [Astraeus odoratus]|nr:hypothetical protein ID866_625 [Astraeus odoratus]
MDENVTWLVPYQFTQNIPSDVDVRVMLTFLELYQTLLGFVFFKLYTDAGLVYPPPLDSTRDEAGAGIGAFSLQITNNTFVTPSKPENTMKKASSKEVRQAIKNISTSTSSQDHDTDMDAVVNEGNGIENDEEFVARPSAADSDIVASLPTWQSLSAVPRSDSSSLFSPYTFFLSREVSRPVFEFLIRSFGGRVGWPPSSGSGSPFTESDDSITHVIIDRPLAVRANESHDDRERRRRRKYVQPQWVADCINAGKVLLEDLYAQSATLPPHLSPFDAKPGAYDPTAPLSEEEADDVSVDDSDGEKVEEAETKHETKEAMAEKPLALDLSDADALRAAELTAEATGVEYGEFEREVRKIRKTWRADQAASQDDEGDMSKVLLSSKKRKLYERMKHSQRKRAAEHDVLKEKRKKIARAKDRSS